MDSEEGKEEVSSSIFVFGYRDKYNVNSSFKFIGWQIQLPDPILRVSGSTWMINF